MFREPSSPNLRNNGMTKEPTFPQYIPTSVKVAASYWVSVFYVIELPISGRMTQQSCNRREAQQF
jgi:hypothetical protein